MRYAYLLFVSDEGNTSDNSIISEEEEEIGFSEGTWTYTVRQPIVSPQYLCAPPPTPTFVPLRSLELTKRRSKKGTATNKTYYLRRRKMLVKFFNFLLFLHVTKYNLDHVLCCILIYYYIYYCGLIFRPEEQ